MANRLLITALGLLGLFLFFQVYFARQNADAADFFKKMRGDKPIDVRDVLNSDNVPVQPVTPPTNVTSATDTTTIPSSPDSSITPNAPVTDSNTTPSTTAPDPATPPPAPPPVVNDVVTPIGSDHSVPVETSAIVLGYHQFVGPGEHSVNPYVMSADVFETEMKYLKDNGYNVVPLSDVVKYVQHQIALPPRAVAITIDDGYKSPITWAAPILKKYGFPWTFFVYPDFIGASGKAASWQNLLDLQAAGVDIECHTYTHPRLVHSKIGKTADQYAAFLNKELVVSKQTIEQKVGKPVPYLAYPYGEYNTEVEAKAIAAGYTAIFTVAGNPVHSSTPIYCIGRFVITKPEEKNYIGYLREGALSLTNPQPAPGSVVNEPRPAISAILSYYGKIKPKSVSAEIKGMGAVACDFDPATSTARIFLQRDLVSESVVVTIHAQDAETSQHVSETWRFDYQPTSGTIHPAPVDTKVPVAPIAKPKK